MEFLSHPSQKHPFASTVLHILMLLPPCWTVILTGWDFKLSPNWIQVQVWPSEWNLFMFVSSNQRMRFQPSLVSVLVSHRNQESLLQMFFARNQSCFGSSIAWRRGSVHRQSTWIALAALDIPFLKHTTIRCIGWNPLWSVRSPPRRHNQMTMLFFVIFTRLTTLLSEQRRSGASGIVPWRMLKHQTPKDLHKANSRVWTSIDLIFVFIRRRFGSGCAVHKRGVRSFRPLTLMLSILQN